MTTHTTLEVNRADIATTRVVSEDVELEPGQVRVRIDRYAVTANNITYAAMGDLLGYWDFFPTGDAEFGRVPAMGWATVVESNHDDVAVGGRYYGWYPMASHAVFTPAVTSDGFRDDGAHRQAHAPVYRAYVSTESDTMYPGGPGTEPDVDGEDRHVLLRGLALTGLLAEEFFADGGGSGASYFGTSRVVVLSASSKTAIGFAQRAALRVGVEVVGVTSAGNREFVESLGYYDSVVSYDDIAAIATNGGAVSIDMAGNASALAAVHAHFGDGLAHSMIVGRSHHDAAPATEPMIGPEPLLFFAPTEVSRRMEQWGRDEYGAHCAAALEAFVADSSAWLAIDHRSDAADAWADVHAGAVAPSSGVVVAP